MKVKKTYIYDIQNAKFSLKIWCFFAEHFIISALCHVPATEFICTAHIVVFRHSTNAIGQPRSSTAAAIAS